MSTAAAAVTLLSVEGYAAEKYRSTPEGEKEERKAREEGAILYRAAKENILRPGVLGGMLGVCKSMPLHISVPGLSHWHLSSQSIWPL